MKTLAIRFTRPDYCTVPGGIILRVHEHEGGRKEYIAHHFVRERGSKIPTAYFWGHYVFDDENKGFSKFNDKVNRAKQWETGGSLIPEHRVDEELMCELEETTA